ncbi:MAG: flavodoxin [Chloroflexi bacterium]|nr:MAG: flavodoxin [Chloroflexota bacterium]
MSDSVLVGYATRYGSTREVAETVAATLRAQGLAVEVQPLRAVRSLAGYRAVVVGAPLFLFRWHSDALRFLARHRAALAQRPVAVFALGPVHDPYDEAEWQHSGDQLAKALAQTPWLTPVALKLFGGKYDPSKLRFPIKQLAGAAPASDLRDWPAIRAWAAALRPLLTGRAEG